MAVVHVPASLRSLSRGCDEIRAEGATLRAVFRAVAEDYPKLTASIMDDDGLRPEMAVAIDGSILDDSGLLDPFTDETEIYLVPPLSGGR
jgi:molybdopterin converting factor small subunit